MTQKLYLLRHAEAGPWNPLGNDFSRSLSTTGILHAQLVSKWAFESLKPPDTIICSPAKRTRQTLAPLLSQWPRLLANTDYVDSMYGASLNMLLTLAEDAFSYSERLLMVGHNPGLMEMLVSVLQPGHTAGVSKMSPGTLAVIDFPDKFKRQTHAGNLRHMIRQENFSIN